MTKAVEVNHAFDANINQKSPELNKILFEGAYGGTGTDIFELLREQRNIGDGKFTEKEAKDFEKIFDQASKQAGATPESIRAALDERAQKLNDFFESHHIGSHVQVVVPKEKGGSGIYKDCSYELVVDQYHAKTNSTETVGFVKWRDPKIANQPIEEKLRS
jgi:hypothetical protein